MITGFTGSLMVISVNALDEPSERLSPHDGHVTDVHPLSALFGNAYLWHELIHMYIAGYIVSGFVLAGVYAFGRLRGRWGRYERTALTIPLTVAALAAPVQILVGDWAAREVAKTQPIKLAAIEGLYKTTRGAPEHILGWYTTRKSSTGSRSPPALVPLLPQLRTRRCRGWTRSPPTSARRSTWCGSPSSRWSASARCSR